MVQLTDLSMARGRGLRISRVWGMRKGRWQSGGWRLGVQLVLVGVRPGFDFRPQRLDTRHRVFDGRSAEVMMMVRRPGSVLG